MAQVTLDLNDELVERLRGEADRAGVDFESYLRLRIAAPFPREKDPFWGFLGDSEWVDELLEEIMANRERQTLRTFPSLLDDHARG